MSIFLYTLLRRLVDEVIELLVSCLEIVVDDDNVMYAGSLGVLELALRLGEALLHALLGLGAAAAEAFLEDFFGGGRDEDVAGGDVGVFDLLDALLRGVAISFFSLLRIMSESEMVAEREKRGRKKEAVITYLHLNIQNHNLTLRALLVNGHLTRPIPVPAKLGMLDEAVGVDEVLKVLHGDEVVVDAMDLAGAGIPRGVGDGEGEDVRVAGEEELEEGAFADARGAGDDDGAGVGGEF